MKTAVVFYSLEGSTKLIARLIEKTLEADLYELKPQKEIPKTGMGKFFWGGKSVIMGEKPALLNEAIDLSQYDTVFIGTPVWAGKYAAPINTFLSKYEIKDKNLAFFACHAGGGAERCFQALTKNLPGNTILGWMDFKEPVKVGIESVRKAVDAWLETIMRDI